MQQMIASVRNLFSPPSHEWRVVSRYGKTTMASGEVVSTAYVWGRRIRGEWQYREMSSDEYNNYIANISI